MVQGQTRQIVHKDPISKITELEVAQVVECLLCKDEALSSNSSPTENKQKQVRIFFYFLSPTCANKHCHLLYTAAHDKAF
jgi:hypothetical protein